MTDTRPFGIDVSRYDGLLNWNAVKAHVPKVHFVAMRSTISWGYRDPFFVANWVAGKGRVLRAAYHVIYPGEDATRQYDNIMTTLNGNIGELPIVIDAELDHGLPKATITRTTRRLADKIIAATHKHPILYSRANWIDAHLNLAELPDLPLWLAHYLKVPLFGKYAPEHPGPPILPKGATTYAIHQTGDHLPTFCATTTKAHQDYDRWNGTVESLYKFAGKTVLEQPVEQPSSPPETIETGGIRLEVLVDGMNVRGGPSTSYAVLGNLRQGEIVTARNVSGANSWVEIAPDRWAAVQYGGVKYMTPLK